MPGSFCRSVTQQEGGLLVCGARENRLSRQDGPILSQPSRPPQPSIAETAELSAGIVMSVPSGAQIQHTEIAREVFQLCGGRGGGKGCSQGLVQVGFRVVFSPFILGNSTTETLTSYSYQ